MSAISHDSSLLNVEKFFLGSSIAEISKASLLDAQKEDPVVGRLLNFMKEGTWPMSWEVKRESPAVKVLLRQRHKLYHDKDGLLFRRSGPFSQLINYLI